MNNNDLLGYVKEVEGMSLVQLLAARAGWKSDTAQWQVVDREITRRDTRGTNMRAWIAIVVSCISMIVSIWVSLR